MAKLPVQEIFEIVVSEAKHGCTSAPLAYSYLMRHYPDRLDPNDLRSFLNVLNFAAIREEYCSYVELPEPKFSVGSTVTVLNKGCTFDTYKNWPQIHHVPNFEYGATPVEGETFTVTHAGLHEHGDQLYVLDGRFIVGPGAFETCEGPTIEQLLGIT